MRSLCVVLTTDYEKIISNKKQDWQKEAEADFETVKQTLAATHDIIEIKVDVYSKDAKVEELVSKKLSDENLANIKSCHIVINSHGSVAKKDLQDAAIKKVIERVSIFNIPISQITALTCHAMANDSIEHQRERLKASGRNADYRENFSLSKDTTIGILIKKIKKMELPIIQQFNIVGPTSSYNAVDDKDLVQAMLQGNTGMDLIKTDSVSTKLMNFSIEDYKNSINNAIDWIDKNKDSEINTNETKQQYNQHTNFLGKVLTKLYEKIENNLKHGNDLYDDVHDESSCLYNCLKNHAIAEMGLEGLDSKNLKKVYRDWIRKNKVSSEERLNMFREYIKNDDKYISPLNSPAQSPLTVSSSVPAKLLPINLENRFFKSIDKIDDQKSLDERKTLKKN